MLLVRRSSLRFPQQTHRNYAQISHKRPLVIPQYHLCVIELTFGQTKQSRRRFITHSSYSPIRTIEAELRSITEVGKSRCRNMRKAAGKEERIPAVLMIPGQDPVYLKVRASTITKFMNDNHFLGRRYNLVVNDRTYDVYPCTLGVHPVLLFHQFPRLSYPSFLLSFLFSIPIFSFSPSLLYRLVHRHLFLSVHLSLSSNSLPVFSTLLRLLRKTKKGDLHSGVVYIFLVERPSQGFVGS
eukprot:TRINITY_DN507_c0_g2_i2.p1 TRINITY_DN507_c0_g2~~TRINITY_DN507_c0_g2_i2.p1  ORF type:complete len:240 (-),score=12.02 TRINITY_DN507_c0_g2_i2:580-1299(-)